MKIESGLASTGKRISVSKFEFLMSPCFSPHLSVYFQVSPFKVLIRPARYSTRFFFLDFLPEPDVGDVPVLASRLGSWKQQ